MEFVLMIQDAKYKNHPREVINGTAFPTIFPTALCQNTRLPGSYVSTVLLKGRDTDA